MSQLENERKINNWKQSVSEAGCTVNSISSIKEVRKRDGSLLFALLETDVISPEGTKLPHILFVRGDACVIITLLKNSQTKEEKFLMVKQRRIGNGQLTLEFPAGMLDENQDPKDVAVRELQEETGLSIDKSDLFSLTEGKLYSSAGASDEGIFYFALTKELDHAEFEKLKNSKGGCCDENEHITTVLMTRNEALKLTTSLQVMLGFYLFDKYQKEKGTVSQ
ncbi:NUDIX hydrolase [Chitinispirillum alkaliphilum]|nr:NUDIX hydrolase [Chitinispirillum alkaliphilum]